MSKTTEHLSLVQLELSDVADVTLMNENWTKLDDEIHEIQTTLEDGVGIDIPSMTLEEYETWLNSEEYDPEQYVAVTDDEEQLISKKIDFTLLASGWKDGNTPYYDFATEYPSDEYDIETIPLATYTEEQRTAIMNANFVGADDNNLYVWGEKPDVDIPIKVKVVAK